MLPRADVHATHLPCRFPAKVLSFDMRNGRLRIKYTTDPFDPNSKSNQVRLVAAAAGGAGATAVVNDFVSTTRSSELCCADTCTAVMPLSAGHVEARWPWV